MIARPAGLRAVGTGSTDFVALAASFGATGFRMTEASDFRPTLEQAPGLGTADEAAGQWIERQKISGHFRPLKFLVVVHGIIGSFSSRERDKLRTISYLSPSAGRWPVSGNRTGQVPVPRPPAVAILFTSSVAALQCGPGHPDE